MFDPFVLIIDILLTFDFLVDFLISVELAIYLSNLSGLPN